VPTASQRLAGHTGDGRRPVEGEGRASGGSLQVNSWPAMLGDGRRTVEGEGRASGGGAQGSTGCTAMAMESWKPMATGDPTFNCS
jgi:hypothetical protein